MSEQEREAGEIESEVGGQHHELEDSELNAMIETICNSKAEEFQMLGYGSVTGKDVWDCVSSKYKETPPLHKVVNDILSLKTTQFMNWMTLSVWKMS